MNFHSYNEGIEQHAKEEAEKKHDETKDYKNIFKSIQLPAYKEDEGHLKDFKKWVNSFFWK